MILRIESLSKDLGRRRIIDELSFELAAGTVLVARGPNGCGKSTLLRIVAGVLAADAGRVEIAGAPVPSPAALSRLGYVPEGADPPEHLTVGEVVALVAALKRAPCPAPSEMAMAAGALADRRIASLSLGQRRRACIAAAMVGSPSLLVFDEPENGLDAAGAADLVALVRAHVGTGGAALIATHDESFARDLEAEQLTLG